MEINNNEGYECSIRKELTDIRWHDGHIATHRNGEGLHRLGEVRRDREGERNEPVE